MKCEYFAQFVTYFIFKMLHSRANTNMLNYSITQSQYHFNEETRSLALLGLR